MNLPIISIHRTVQGREVREDFKFHDGSAPWVYICQNCGRTHLDALTPVEMVDDSEENAIFSGQTLCEGCCLWPDIGDGWPGLTLTEMQALWALVRSEQQRDAANQSARERSVASTLEDLQAAVAALQETRTNHGVDGVGKGA